MCRNSRRVERNGTPTTATASKMTKDGTRLVAATVASGGMDPNSCSGPMNHSTAHSDFQTNSDSNSKSNLDSDSDAYSDPDTELEDLSNTDIESGDDAERDPESDKEIDAEAEKILKDIARFREEGPAKPRHTPQTINLWKAEREFWKQFCSKIQQQTKLSPEEQLRKCDLGVFKSYLFWRKENFRIKKESSMRSYWKRVCMYYYDVTGYAMGNKALKDICNWLPSLGLSLSNDEKPALFVHDLYPILHAIWIDDTKPLHSFIRVQISLLILLSAATATRPGALVESASNKGSNKAVCFKDVELWKVRSFKDPTRSTIVANLNLEHVKNKEKGGTPKKFTFRLEGLPAFCIVSYMLGIGGGRNAFRDNFTSFQQIFDLVIPEERNLLRIKWKKELLDKPFFCDVIGGVIYGNKAFSYAKYRDTFVRWGRVAGIERRLELYQVRRGSGRNISSALTSTERNQTMGHAGATYEKYYTPTHIARDFQAIYFGTPSEEELIRSVASMGLSRDRRAPTELSEDQQREVRDDPMLEALREERQTYKERLHDQGFYPLSKAKGTHLHNEYEKVNRKIGSTYQKLQRIRLDLAIREFHDSIDTIEIARQLSGRPAAEVLSLPPIEFEFRERAIVAGMLFKPFEREKARIRFISTLARLCHRQETRQPKALKRKKMEFVTCDSYRAPSPRMRRKVVGEFESSPRSQVSKVVEEPDTPGCGEIVEARSQRPFPVAAPYLICGFCANNEQLSDKAQMKHWERRDVLNKHEDIHFRDSRYQGVFTCPYPNCVDMVDGRMHWNRHSLDKHKIRH
ncbi:hypothetical protein B0J11DRAFT_543970 [Dendryphion nanum]|uniref:C2H2-type domain-containing protein n=1 Tax=Dendryphion nanum TaxID=256645 RepID=A0A9P9D2B4_9PLEO|nr:hypothetical protein B0J11DRAFT_543970 [Dendryphion nanum]